MFPIPTGLIYQQSVAQPRDGDAEESAGSARDDVRQAGAAQRTGVAETQPVVRAKCRRPRAHELPVHTPV